MNRPKLVMIGLDAGDRRFIEAHQDVLPFLRQAFREGRPADLETPSGLLTGSVWPSFCTGRSPGEHGIYHHLQWDALTMRLRRVTADWLGYEPFWCELDRRGVKVAVLDVPMTFPSRLRYGVEIINWGAHDQLCAFHANRPDLARGIRRRFGRHPMGAEIPVDKTRGQLEDIRSRLVRGVRRKGALARWLLELDAWDLFLAVFGECHRGGHLLWPEADPGSAIPRDALLDVYRAVDAELQQLAAALPRGAGPLILFSLHGMEANRSQEHFVPRLMDRINAGFRGETLPSMAPPAEQRSLMRYLRGALPARLQNAVAQAVPVGVRDWVVSRAVAGGYDWGRTPGFALLADSNGYVRLNLVGRERDGCLDTPELRGRYAHWLRDRFLGLRVGAAGEPLVREVVATRSVFPGTRCDFLPDFVVTWEDAAPATCVQSEALGTIEARLETGRSGNHRHAGFCVSLRRGGAPPCPPEHIQDLAPLAQELLGIR